MGLGGEDEDDNDASKNEDKRSHDGMGQESKSA